MGFSKKIESYENWNDLAIAYDKFLDFKKNKKNESIPRLIPKKYIKYGLERIN